MSRKPGQKRRKRGQVVAGKTRQTGHAAAACRVPVAARLPAEPLHKGLPNREVVALFLAAKLVIVAAVFFALQVFFAGRFALNLWVA